MKIFVKIVEMILQMMKSQNSIYVSNNAEMKNLILGEVNKKPYSFHLGYQKTITTLKK
jgi:hypothetical protein